MNFLNPGEWSTEHPPNVSVWRKLGQDESGTGSIWPRLLPKVHLRIISKPTSKLPLLIGMQLREKPWVWLPAQN